MFTKSNFLTALALITTTVTAAPAHADHDHASCSHTSAGLAGLGKKWYQDADSETAKLFRRAPLEAGSPEWHASYPDPGTTPPTSGLPQAWLDRLAEVTASPDFPKFGPTQPNNGYPTYDAGFTGTDPEVCSFTYECVSEEDLVDAPDGVVGLNFDDGPTTFSPELYDYIEKNNISATHFMIGGAIYYNWQTFQRAVQDGGHIASHTWSHPYMTTLTNEQIVAELGWTSQIIADLNDGRVPAYWRPPFGDTDNRVRMIAQQVFGLRTVPWQIGRDSADWSISDTNPGQNTRESVIAAMTGWLTDPARKGYIGLQHEASQADLDVFFAVYPIMIQNNWTVSNVAEASNLWEYINSEDNESPVVGPTAVVQTASPGALTTYQPMQASTGTASQQSSGTSSAASSSSSAGSSSASGSSTSAAPSTSTAATASGTRSAAQTASTSAMIANNAANGAGQVSPMTFTGMVSLAALTWGLFY